jgi:hypothetical protein
MQKRPLEMGDGADVTRYAAMNTAVQRVADDRVADGAEMHADLMCAAGVNGHLAQRQSRQVNRFCNAGDGLTRPARARGHFLPVHRIPANWRLDAPAGLHDAPDKRDVLLLHFAIVKLARQFLMRRIVFRDDDDARRAAIEPMDDARPQLASNAAQIRDVVEEGVHERSRCMPCAGVNDHSGRFVDDDNVAVLIEDFQRRRFRLNRRRRRLREVDDNVIAGMHGKIGAHLACADTDSSVREFSGDSALEHARLAYAATRRRRGIRCGVSGVERRSQISIASASGTSSSEMN